MRSWSLFQRLSDYHMGIPADIEAIMAAMDKRRRRLDKWIALEVSKLSPTQRLERLLHLKALDEGWFPVDANGRYLGVGSRSDLYAIGTPMAYDVGSGPNEEEPFHSSFPSVEHPCALPPLTPIHSLTIIPSIDTSL